MNRRSGSALLMVVTLSSLLILATIVAGVNSISDIGLTNDEKIKTQLELACEAGLKRAKAKVEQYYNNKSLICLEPNIRFEGTATDVTGTTPAEKAYSDETFVAGSDYYTFSYHNSFNNKNIIVKYTIVDETGESSTGWTKSTDSNYTTKNLYIESTAYIEGENSWVGMSEETSIKRAPLFIYLAFFNDDLEILPGPNFDLKGSKIHTNGNLYLNANAGSTLNIFTNSITSAMEIFRGRLDSSDVTGTVNVTSGNINGDLVTMDKTGNDAKNSNWKNTESQKWNGAMQDKHLDGKTIEIPDQQAFAPGGYYDKNAGLKISVLAKGKSLSQTTYKITYNGITSTYTSTQLNGALSEVKMYDRREYGTSKQIQVTNVDISKLSSAIGYPKNGLVYMTRDDAVPDNDGNQYTPDPNRVVSGFKLINGSTLPAASTFVSNLPTYIKGDFNLHTSTNSNTDKWKPCAVISDSINLLSNNWYDSKSNTSQTASSTTFNTLFITGNVPTKPGQYSGGLENFPRFLENWSGKTATITGGFIELFRSKYATGLWGGSYYSPPTRDWQAESRFETNKLADYPPDFPNLFPSTNEGIAYSDWSKITKSEAILSENN